MKPSNSAAPGFNLRTFDLNLLKVFDVVMTERSLTKAAKHLSLTQPAVSNALRRLRESLGDELLVRKGRALQPSARALVLWPSVQEALRSLQASLAPSLFDPATADTAFVLAMADATAAELMPGLVAVLGDEAPGVSLRVLPLTTRDPRKLLDDGQADLAIGHFPAALADLTARAQLGETVSFMHHRLFQGEYVCVMRQGHPFAKGPLTLHRFCNARHMLVSFSGRAFGFVDEALALKGRTRRVVLTVNQFFTAGKVVANSDLLTVLPRHFINVTGFADQLVQRELPFDVPTVQVDALWHHRQDASSAHAWLRAKVLALADKAFPA
ncbi:LysR family transcriptional regulator [Rhodoferax lacus]|uniref:LysR family transcriptional regulator n=1 Tax=Rhodoferax lacus TaxID=2184758 RepID=A0A3E1R7Q6_9BURK|nr:LysR family transcriptional regulator [Rhodoferax lacus]RFO95396.1 LysR family transcriptional regulator [Rhodoferax lacus]